ncbi:paraneoplastic antigen-like protein 8B [Echinops telfairi]|uniref:Paraneoplastic antigen-like protein 8B n=1 Tax=Echinops telfairi TaxID=9371 RepID=A0ABM0IY32_ECHTE|nr:paraneoplastic antigen-like protein 8B [Echinops telfairi]
MALSLLDDWCRGMGVDVRRALLVTGIPESLDQAAVEAVLQPAFQALGDYRLRSTRVVRREKARAVLVELLEDFNHAAVPREVLGPNGVWKVQRKDRAQDARVLRQMKRLLLDERPTRGQVVKALEELASSGALETQTQGSGQAARPAGPPTCADRKAHRGRQGRRSRVRGSRLTKKGKKRGRGGRPWTPVRSESSDSSDDSLGIFIEELDEDEDEDRRALYSTLQAAAKELVKKWATQNPAEEGDGPREFLALVTVTDKAKKEETAKEPPSSEPINADANEDRKGVPDLVALLAVRGASDEFPDSDTSSSESQDDDDEDQESDDVDNPEFVAIAAYTDPSDSSAREEMLKIASVIESLGWGVKDPQEALSQVLSVMSKDAMGPRVKVEVAGREVEAVVLRKAKDQGNFLECISTLAEPETPGEEKDQQAFLSGWDQEDDEGGLLELVALLAAQDMADTMKEEKETAWDECAKYKHAKGNLGEVLALLAAREIVESDEESSSESSSSSSSSSSEDEEEEEESEDSESEEEEESGPEERASRKPRAKRARTAARSLGQAGASPAAPPAPTGTRKPRAAGRGRGRASTPEKKAGGRTSAQDDGAGTKKKKRHLGPHAKGEAKAQPRSARGKKARRGRRLPPKCR